MIRAFARMNSGQISSSSPFPIRILSVLHPFPLHEIQDDAQEEDLIMTFSIVIQE